jgi:uncharacterized protein (TIGR02466 family)
MSYHYIFPTAIFEDTQNYLAEQMLPIANEYLDKHGSAFLENSNHITTARTTIDNDIASDIRFKPFLDYVYEQCDEFLKFQRIDYKKYHYTPYITLNRIKKDGYHKLHSHPNCIISGCFYLDVPKGSSNILFRDPRDYHKYYQLEYNFDDGLGDPNCLKPDIVKEVKTGDVLMWNSWLEHEVLPNKIDATRTTLVFNIGVK